MTSYSNKLLISHSFYFHGKLITCKLENNKDVNHSFIFIDNIVPQLYLPFDILANWMSVSESTNKIISGQIYWFNVHKIFHLENSGVCTCFFCTTYRCPCPCLFYYAYIRRVTILIRMKFRCFFACNQKFRYFRALSFDRHNYWIL